MKGDMYKPGFRNGFGSELDTILNVLDFIYNLDILTFKKLVYRN